MIKFEPPSCDDFLDILTTKLHNPQRELIQNLKKYGSVIF